MKKSALFFFLVVALSCSKDDDSRPDVPSDFLPYFERFKSEASARNMALNYDHLKIEFVDQSSLPGYCGWGDVNPPHVRIVQSDGCWNSQRDLNKEILIFHELGHSILHRQHLSDTLPNGDFKSMMTAANQFNIYSESTPERRQYYVDELFDPSTPVPTWAAAKTQTNTLLSDSIGINQLSASKWLFVKNQSNAVPSVDHLHYATPGHSLAIASPSAGTSFSYWMYTIDPSQIPVGSRLVLKVKIQTENVVGRGAYFALRGDDPSGLNFFETTEDVMPVTGSQDFKEYSVHVSYFPAGISVIYIYLLFDGGNTGKVYFDDIRLINAY